MRDRVGDRDRSPVRPAWKAFALVLLTSAWIATPSTARPQDDGPPPPPPREVGPLLDVALDSLAGPLRRDAWRPLGFDTLFSEG